MFNLKSAAILKQAMLLRFRTMSAALIAGAMILGPSVTEAPADVIYSTFGQADFFDTVVGYSDSPLANESATVRLSSTGGSDLASVKVAASDFTGNSVQLAIHPDLLEFLGTTSDAIIPVIRHIPVITQTDSANLRSHFTEVGLRLLVDSNHLLPTSSTNRGDIFFKVKQGDVGGTFSGDTDDTVIVAIVDASYRIYSMLVSKSSPLADPGTLALLGFGLAGLSYIGRIWNTYP